MISLELIKKHLNIDADYTEDDTLLTHYRDVAYKVIYEHLDEDIDRLLSKGDGDIPSPLLQGILLLIGDFYQSRESVAFNSAPVELPLSFNYLMSLYKNYYGR